MKNHSSLLIFFILASLSSQVFSTEQIFIETDVKGYYVSDPLPFGQSFDPSLEPQARNSAKKALTSRCRELLGQSALVKLEKLTYNPRMNVSMRGDSPGAVAQGSCSATFSSVSSFYKEIQKNYNNINSYDGDLLSLMNKYSDPVLNFQ